MQKSWNQVLVFLFFYLFLVLFWCFKIKNTLLCTFMSISRNINCTFALEELKKNHHLSFTKQLYVIKKDLLFLHKIMTGVRLMEKYFFLKLLFFVPFIKSLLFVKIVWDKIAWYKYLMSLLVSNLVSDAISFMYACNFELM